MPGVQNKYSVDVNNRFNCDEEDDVESDNENVDPFEQLKQLNKAAEQAKLAPKPKKPVQKKKPVEKKVETEKKVEKRDDKPRRAAPRRDYQDRRQNDEGGAVDTERPKREFRPRGERGSGFGGGDGEARGGGGGGGAPRKNFDRRSRDPRSSAKGYDKKEGSGTGNWGNVDDELTGQTEKVETEIKDEKATETVGEDNNQTTEEKPVREPEVATMTLEEFRAQKKSVNRNPNAKANDDDDVKETKKDHEAKRKGRAGRMAPVDFRPAPLVAPRGGGDRRGGERKYNNNRGDGYKAKKQTASSEGYNLENDFPSL